MSTQDEYGRSGASALDIVLSQAVRGVVSFRTDYVCSLKDVQKLLDKGADPNVRDADGGRPLGNLVNAPVYPQIREDETSEQAVAREQTGIASLLLARGADPEMPDARGDTPLMKSIKYLSVLLAQVYLPVTKNIEATDADGNTAVMLAASHATKGDTLLDAILGRDPKLEARNVKGETALMLAVAACDDDSTRKLLEAGARVDAADNDGNSVLTKVRGSWKTYETITRRLLDAGANPLQTNNEGQTAKDYLIARGDENPAAVSFWSKFNPAETTAKPSAAQQVRPAVQMK